RRDNSAIEPEAAARTMPLLPWSEEWSFVKLRSFRRHQNRRQNSHVRSAHGSAGRACAAQTKAHAGGVENVFHTQRLRYTIDDSQFEELLNHSGCHRVAPIAGLRAISS